MSRVAENGSNPAHCRYFDGHDFSSSAVISKMHSKEWSFSSDTKRHGIAKI